MTDPLEEVADRVEAIRSTSNYALLGEIPAEPALKAISGLAAAIQLRLKALGR